jgi:hypothetical protein
MYDFGVLLRHDTGKIWLSMQFYDPCGKPAIKNNYHVEAKILFLGQTLELNIDADVDWPENKAANP